MIALRLAALAAAALAFSAHAQNPAATITVDAAANRHAIDPRVYGVAHASGAVLSELNVPVNRHGGNSTTRYNWQVNADNRGFDWYFESLAYGSAAAGEGWDSFVQMSRDGGAQPMLTVPIIGWVAKLGPNRGRLASFSIAKYGAQQGSDWQWFPDAGNGVRANGTLVTGNDPNDANVLVDSTFQQQGVQHVVNRWGAAAQGGVRYYILDNEHSIWHSTHRDVRPTGATMDEIRAKMIDHATKIKAVDPNALVLGPEEWGWSGYLMSGYDQQWGSQNGWSNLPDRAAHGGTDYLPWLLRQFRDQHNATGQRLLDVFTVHYYPQGGEFGNDTSTAMQLRRNRSTRSLWDPSYTDETWIADKVRLIPRLKEWVAANYPGTPVGITEYNWGAEGHINGATALADVLGIFGREALDMAAYWTHPAQGTPAYNAIRMYRNYDGNRSTFGETSVAASGPNPDNVAVFAAQRASDRALTVMVINKYLTGNTPAHIDLRGFSTRGPAQLWRLTSTNAIARQADVAVASGAIDVVLPPQSISLFVVPAATAAASADFDGAGASDLLWAHADGRATVALMNGATATATAQLLGAGSGFTALQLADMNGDGRADIVWQHTDGRVVVWLMNGTAVAGGGGILGAGTGWTPAFTGDFNGDGKADLLWRHANGSYAIWLMDGMTTLSGGTILNTGTGWNATLTADFNGDGRADILWTHADGRAAIWLMNGTTMTGGGSIIGPGTGWRVLQAGDFDGDGKADLVWQHTDGRMALWLMNGASMAGGAGILAAGTGWTAARAADFNGDGRADLLLQHPDGRAAIWLMNGATIASQAQVLNAGSGWSAKRTGDFNADGKADIVWQHADGRTALWLMNGTALAGGGQIAQGSGFTVVGAGP